VVQSRRDIQMNWQDILKNNRMKEFADTMASEYKREFPNNDPLTEWPNFLDSVAESPKKAVDAIRFELEEMDENKPSDEPEQYHPQTKRMGYTYGPYGSPQEWKKMYSFFKKKLKDAQGMLSFSPTTPSTGQDPAAAMRTMRDESDRMAEILERNRKARQG